MHTIDTSELNLLKKNIVFRKRWDIFFVCIGLLSLGVCLLALVILLLDMVMTGVPRLNSDFFTHFPSRRPENAGILSAWVGSLLVMTVTGLTAVPLGIAAGVYLEEYAKKNTLTDLIEINITNLAGVPSIVYGLLALGLLVNTLHLGQSILSAGLTLALLILPIVIVATRESLRAVSIALREAAYGMGATKWQTTLHHTLPAATPGIMTGVIIGMSRAIGETAPIITIGALTFIAFLPPVPLMREAADLPVAGLFDWLFAPFTVMPIQMFNWTSRPEEAFQVNAATAGLVLVLMTLSMNAMAIYIRYRLRKTA